MCRLHIRCSMSISFTCIAVLSCLVVKGGYTCEIWIVGKNNKLLEELARGSVLPEDEARMDIFARYFKKNSRLNMYKVYDDVIHMKKKMGVGMFMTDLFVTRDTHYSCY